MDDVGPIEDLSIGEQLRVCPGCGYLRGFHLSLGQTSSRKGYKIIVVCPNCGARYDIGLQIPKDNG